MQIALSIKQPWATLVVHGLKQIEIRRWSTAHRGRVLIHSGQIADERPEAWAHLPDELREYTSLRGGIIGAVDLVACHSYRSLDAFTRDCARHLNEPSWYMEPVLYGFELTNPATLPFRRFAGNVRFFRVPATGALKVEG